MSIANEVKKIIFCMAEVLSDSENILDFSCRLKSAAQK